MASISTLVDRVKIFVNSSGTGPFVLGAAVPAFRGVEALQDGATYSYAVENGSNYEAGTCEYVSSLGQLVRTPVISSNGGAAVAFPAGVQVAFTALAQDLIATGGTFPIIDSLGPERTAAASQRATTEGIESAISISEGLRNDLAGDAGGALVGVKGPGPADIPRTALAKVYDTYSVKDAGAKGDNATDDTAAIQAALDYAGTQVQNILTGVDLVTAAVYLPAGRYKTSAPLVIPEGVRFYSDGPGSAIIYPQHAGEAIIIGGDDRYYSNIQIDGITVVGKRSGTLSYGAWTTATTAGIYAEKAIRNCKVTNCFVTQCVVNYAFRDCWGLSIDGVYGIYALEANLWGNNLTASSIKRSRFDWSEQDGIVIDATQSDLGTSATIQTVIENCAIQICWRNGIKTIDAGMIVVKDCFFESNYREATSASSHNYADINFQDSVGTTLWSHRVEGCFFTPGSSPAFNAYTAIRCARSNHLTVIANVVRSSRYWRFIDADDVNVLRITALGNDAGATGQVLAYSSATTYGLFQGAGPWGENAVRIPQLSMGGMFVTPRNVLSSVTIDDKATSYFVDCSGGNRWVFLPTAQAVPGRRIVVKKTDGGSTNLTISPEAGGGYTIDGAADLTLSDPYAYATVEFSGINWFRVG